MAQQQARSGIPRHDGAAKREVRRGGKEGSGAPHRPQSCQVCVGPSRRGRGSGSQPDGALPSVDRGGRRGPRRPFAKWLTAAAHWRNRFTCVTATEPKADTARQIVEAAHGILSTSQLAVLLLVHGVSSSASEGTCRACTLLQGRASPFHALLPAPTLASRSERKGGSRPPPTTGHWHIYI